MFKTFPGCHLSYQGATHLQGKTLLATNNPWGNIICRQKAFIELPNVDMMKKAISEMCYKKILGLNLKVDVPYFLPKLREEILGRKGWIDPQGWKWHKQPQVMGEIMQFSLH